MTDKIPRDAFQSTKFLLHRDNVGLANSIHQMLLSNKFVEDEKLRPSFENFIRLIKLIKEGFFISIGKFGKKCVPKNLTIVTDDYNNTPPDRFYYKIEGDELMVGMLFLARHSILLDNNSETELLNQTLSACWAVKLTTVKECYRRYQIRSLKSSYDDAVKASLNANVEEKIMEMIHDVKLTH